MFKWIYMLSNTNRPFYSKRKISGKYNFGVNDKTKEWEFLGMQPEKYIEMLSIYIPFFKIKNQHGIMFSKITDKRLKISVF